MREADKLRVDLLMRSGIITAKEAKQTEAPKMVGKRKGIGLRIALAIAAVGVGLAVQVLGAVIDKFIYIEILPRYSFGVLGLIFTILGFAVMGYLVYKWAIK